MKHLFQLFGLAANEPSIPQTPVPPTGGNAEETAAQIALTRDIPRALAAMVTHAWKAQQKLKPRHTDEEQTPDQRRLSRHIEAILDEAKEIGITLKDRVSEEFDYGLPERVVASEPQVGLSKPVVKETIRPTIIWHNHILVHGEVVLATPIESAPTISEPSHA